jgi:two-component sensor histidine kinase
MLQLVSSTENRKPKTAESTEEESARLAILKRYDIVDTAPETGFDRIAAIAADLLSAPIAIISFVDSDRAWFKSHHGLAETGADRGPGAAAAALAPWIQLNFKHGFHISAPLRTFDGHELGRLTVIDLRPRRVDGQQMRRLKTLAAMVMDCLELRLAAHAAALRALAMASEADHRAMNSLQLIASVLRLQSDAVGSPVAARQLTAAANRVLAVARVHRAFCIHETRERVPIVPYLRQLCGELSESLTAEIAIDGAEATISKAQLLPIGLVVNELVTNAKKHGGGRITVDLRCTADGQRELCVHDEGPGLPKGFSIGRPGSEGIGMTILGALAGQLNGTISAQSNSVRHPGKAGSCFMVSFPAV